MKAKLTDAFVKNITPPASGRLDIVDETTPGLVLRVMASGVKSWSIRYRPKGRKQLRESYGTYPSTSLSDARARAKALTAAASVGRDLVSEEAAAAAAKAEEEAKAKTIADVVADYIKAHVAKTRKAGVTEKLFANHIVPVLGKKTVGELRRADVVELLDSLKNKGWRTNAQVNRVHAALKACLNWAVEREYLDANPAAVVKKQVTERPRDRVLSDGELKAIWEATDVRTDPSRAFIRLLILTGARRDEIRCMTWSEIDLEKGIWTLPKARNKGHRDHVVPLSNEVKAILEALPRLGECVITTDGKIPYAGQKSLKESLDKAVGASNWEHWTLHDFRRTVTTGMSALGVREEHRERALNHAVGGIGNKVYDRHAYLDEKRAALQAWADRVMLIVDTSGPQNVVAFEAS
ncbi:hypothetical protein WV31_02845 [Magnetospirillum sp. ME-1]|uniref:tyrosine-type recombinase/integrase n=1 Tax=Magnetospirillum sp. ME-1 TaxID=1639348 RepID=UPI000A17B8B1|nr:site-specific integrase [Magnetospirillum sp. ME-1]ARJ64682.1 hypothetical protein WV31_02845 [Magnetospirillum sp. ME-1]